MVFGDDDMVLIDVYGVGWIIFDLVDFDVVLGYYLSMYGVGVF